MPGHSRMPLAVLTLAAMLCGCYELDPLLYAPLRTDKYIFDPNGTTPLDTITADRIEPLTLTTEDGATLGAVYVRANTTPARGYALFFHGRGVTIDLDFQHPKEISNLGYDVLAVDYRGWGMSSALPPTEAGIEQDTRAARDWLIQRAGGTERLFYYGVSLGAAFAIQRAREDSIQALVLESGFSSLQNLALDATFMDMPSSHVASARWDAAAQIREVRAPVLLLHGLEDFLIRPTHSQILLENANEPKQLVLVEHGTHGQLAREMGDSYIAIVNGFLHRYIPPE